VFLRSNLTIELKLHYELVSGYLEKIDYRKQKPDGANGESNFQI
jgi:hypothetical protein